MVELGLLEHCVREELNRSAPRRMAVLKPLKLTLVDWPAERFETLDAVNNPEDAAAGKPAGALRGAKSGSTATTSWKTRRRSSSGWLRAARCGLRWGYIVKCVEVVKDAAGRGRRAALHARSRPRAAARTADGRKVQGTIHWVSAAHAVDARVRLYDHLFQAGGPRRRARRRRLDHPRRSGIARSPRRLQGRAGARRGARRANASSSSASATSSPTSATTRPRRRCSTAS